MMQIGSLIMFPNLWIIQRLYLSHTEIWIDLLVDSVVSEISEQSMVNHWQTPLVNARQDDHQRELDKTSATPKSTTFTLRLGFNVNVPSAFSFQLTLCTMTKQRRSTQNLRSEYHCNFLAALQGNYILFSRHKSMWQLYKESATNNFMDSAYRNE